MLVGFLFAALLFLVGFLCFFCFLCFIVLCVVFLLVFS